MTDLNLSEGATLHAAVATWLTTGDDAEVLGPASSHLADYGG